MNLSDLLPAAGGGGGVASIQTGGVEISTGLVPGTGLDTRYYDVTITAVDPSKCLVSFEGGAGTAANDCAYKAGPTASVQPIAHLTSATNLRIGVMLNAGAHLRGRWTVVEFN